VDVDNTGTLSVVVPTRDRADFLDRCLRSLRQALREDDELIVADSASSDPRVREVAEAHGATYVRCDLPGASRARNAGWRSATKPFMAFIDDDVRVLPGWAQAIADCFARHPEASFVSGKVDTPMGEDPSRGVPFLLHTDECWIDRAYDEDPGHSANLTVRRAVLERLGGFDEELGAGARYRAAEDKDLFDRMFAAGLRGRYEPTAEVLHLDWRDRRETLRLNWTYGLGTGARIVKLLKSDRPRAKQIIQDTLWLWGLREVYRSLRRRNKWMLLITTFRTLGMCSGIVWASTRPVRDGHFVQSRRGVDTRSSSPPAPLRQ
jgi:glycosyltransferase involved in cell wall biosynthesis